MTRPLFTLLAASLLLGGCSDSACDSAPAGGDAAQAAPSPAPAAPAATGRVIEIRAVTDDKGNYFEPREVEARRGDVLRVVLVSGVHNLNFLADSNPSGAVLPPATEMLQLPGQTVDIPVTMAEGEYYFQCDPHAALGMVGELEVED
ncbi:MAG: plastocyanin/azurin family copper-binding protein [Gemmatimonadota bacterium]|nr:plastocyanin/azurin family copper-binding protein [Gemmatimonadota bacterium]